jgi:molybdopterin-guanine dinucleotide biosynthesis protein A
VRDAIAGIFVGGKATRMGGRAKGLLLGTDGRTLVDRLSGVLTPLVSELVLVGEASAYASAGLEAIEDEVPGIGPLGGLVGLLRRGSGRMVLALAGDMPWVSPGLIGRLLGAPEEAPIVAPRLEGRWEPLCARYDSRIVLPLALAHAAAADRSLQRLLDAAPAVPLPEGSYDPRELRDWDEPADIREVW